MVVMLPRPRFRNRKISRATRRPHFECLETRTLPSTTVWPGFTNSVAEAPAHATLDQAQDLGDLTAADVERIAERSDVRAMLLATDRLVKLPGLEDWLRQRYPEVRQIDSERRLYLSARRP